jgi:hypothetical protein
MQEPIPKIARDKRAGDVAQVVQHLPSKHKALNSNSSNAQNKKGQTATTPSLLVMSLQE